MLKFTFSIGLLLAGMVALGQNQGQRDDLPQNGTSGKPATMKEMRKLRQQEEKDWSLQYVKFSYDFIPTGRMLLRPSKQGQEIQASAKFYKYVAVVEAGFQNFSRGGASYDYKSSGNFFRLGAEVNLLKAEEQNGEMTFGLRYARSSFEDQITYTGDVGFGDETFQFENPNARMSWVELTAGLNMIMWKNLHMGYTIRYKVLKNISGTGTLEPFDVPGYGRYQKESALGFSYYIGWAIPFGKDMETIE